MGDGIGLDVVRVFTGAGDAHGNELGVLRSSPATAGREQEIAHRLGFSETVFVDEVGDDGARVRIFTPATELPFAGHPSVGTAWWLAREGTPVRRLLPPAGAVAVRVEDGLTWVSARPEWAPDFTFHQLGGPAEVDALRPAAFTEGAHYLWAWIDEPAGTIRSRLFPPVYGVVEDEATGSAAIRLAVLLGRELTISQGRGSVLRARPTGDGWAEVGGTTVFDRTMDLPGVLAPR
jgi:predicted PhzF superfamily epimerase YddE/YHI9